MIISLRRLLFRRWGRWWILCWGLGFLLLFCTRDRRCSILLLLPSAIWDGVLLRWIILWRGWGRRRRCLLILRLGTDLSSRLLPSKLARWNRLPRWRWTGRTVLFSATELWMWYVGVFVVPEEVGEGEEGEVVVGSFEAGEAGENDYG